MNSSSSADEGRPFLDGDDDGAAPTRGANVETPVPDTRSWAQRNQWVVYALASGACAAFNGVFAKL
jgi:tRNA wybutosine-synthesizing protein 1